MEKGFRAYKAARFKSSLGLGTSVFKLDNLRDHEKSFITIGKPL